MESSCRSLPFHVSILFDIPHFCSPLFFGGLVHILGLVFPVHMGCLFAWRWSGEMGRWLNAYLLIGGGETITTVFMMLLCFSGVSETHGGCKSIVCS